MKDNNKTNDDQNNARMPIAIDMLLALIVPLIDTLAAGWLRWRSVNQPPKSEEKKDEGINRQPATGTTDLPVSDVRGGPRAATAPTSPGFGIPAWQRDPRKAAYHPPDDHE